MRAIQLRQLAQLAEANGPAIGRIDQGFEALVLLVFAQGHRQARVRMSSVAGDAATMRSPEGVELELPIATPAPRIAAYAIDGALVAGIALTLFVLFLIGSPQAEWLFDRMKEW